MADGLGCLGHHAKSWLKFKQIDISFIYNDIDLSQILSKPTHLDMPMTPDNNRVISSLFKLPNLFMGKMNQGTGGIPQLQTFLPG
jgi:hypothetical protein